MEPTPDNNPPNLSRPKPNTHKGEEEGKNSYQSTPYSKFPPQFNIQDTGSIGTWWYKIQDDTGGDNLNSLSGHTISIISTSIYLS